MQKRSSTPKAAKKPTDFNMMAASIVAQAVGDQPKIEPPPKLAAAVELGRLGGLKGGKARATKLSAAKRAEIARKAAKARWKRKAT